MTGRHGYRGRWGGADVGGGQVRSERDGAESFSSRRGRELRTVVVSEIGHRVAVDAVGCGAVQYERTQSEAFAATREASHHTESRGSRKGQPTASIGTSVIRDGP